MQESGISTYLEILRGRALSDGGFAHRLGGSYRPDATAWAILALRALRAGPDLIEPAQARLAADQLKDGRVSIAPYCPQAFWPTPLAVLAWHDSPAYKAQQARALEFLLATTGLHWKREPNCPFAHDPAIPGWPWVAGTHSWVEPTSLALIALKVTGYGQHERVRQGVRLLLDRQLPRGGWNYGNTLVFGRELYPAPESTGVALDALSGLRTREGLEKSLAFLQSQTRNLRTPLSLGWALLGLGAWEERPSEARAWILESLARQGKYGDYDTALISLLLVALVKTGGLESLFA
jgi:hypothetical protein